MAAPARSHVAAGPVVLVVDDEPAVCRITARTLAGLGFAVLEAHSGDEALGILETASVLAVVTDLRMRPMTGLELYEHIRRRWPGLPVLLMSGYAENALPAYPASFLPKPFTAERLLSVVRELLATGDAPPP
jgi:two-component system response regulator GlrR